MTHFYTFSDVRELMTHFYTFSDVRELMTHFYTFSDVRELMTHFYTFSDVRERKTHFIQSVPESKGTETQHKPMKVSNNTIITIIASNNASI